MTMIKDRWSKGRKMRIVFGPDPGSRSIPVTALRAGMRQACQAIDDRDAEIAEQQKTIDNLRAGIERREEILDKHVRRLAKALRIDADRHSVASEVEDLVKRCDRDEMAHRERRVELQAWGDRIAGLERENARLGGDVDARIDESYDWQDTARRMASIAREWRSKAAVNMRAFKIQASRAQVLHARVFQLEKAAQILRDDMSEKHGPVGRVAADLVIGGRAAVDHRQDFIPDSPIAKINAVVQNLLPDAVTATVEAKGFDIVATICKHGLEKEFSVSLFAQAAGDYETNPTEIEMKITAAVQILDNAHKEGTTP